MGTDLIESPKALAILDKPVVAISSAIDIARKARAQWMDRLPFGGYVGHRAEGARRACYVGRAIEIRDFMLPYFAQVDRAATALYDELSGGLERGDTVAMVSALFRGLGIKPSDDTEDLAAGCIRMLESDALGLTTGLWKPIGATPAILALAVQKMTRATKYKPKPCELREACEVVRRSLEQDYCSADNWRATMLDSDIVLLEFDHAAWERAWLDPQYHPMLKRVLDLHADRDEHYEALVNREIDDWCEPLLRLPSPEPRRIAACKTRPVKRTRKPKQTNKQTKEEER